WGLLFPNDYRKTSPLDPQLLFSGQYYDSESGLAYNRFRYYDPQSGNYLTSDPIGLNGGETPYGYVHNPMGWVDPLGLSTCAIPKGIPGRINTSAPDLSYDDAATFLGGNYQKITLTEDLHVFRAGEVGKPYGRFFSLDKPISEIQVRIDKAILPIWPGTNKRGIINQGYELIIPKGNTIYVGDIAPQGGIYLGGTQQIFMPNTRDIGLKVIDSFPLYQ
ncbi:RHS repeat-associated core domain-containing protein, partial [Glaesserella sp.]|uniref:RHS repeat-associated core domain-containing protein n=1 Tax=Glaesserella sp. TaxID=2094731 RepID=UPI0035A1AAC2